MKTQHIYPPRLADETDQEYEKRIFEVLVDISTTVNTNDDIFIGVTNRLDTEIGPDIDYHHSQIMNLEIEFNKMKETIEKQQQHINLLTEYILKELK